MKINFHVIFSNEMEDCSKKIRNQFLNSLTQGYSLKAGVSNESWNGVVTRQSLRDLGAKWDEKEQKFK